MEKIVPFGGIVRYGVRDLVRILFRQPQPYRLRGEHLSHPVDTFGVN